MPASVPTGAGELLPPAPGPFCPTRRPQQPAWALSTSRPPRALQPPLGLSSVADSSLPQAFARAIPAAWDTVPCPCTPPHTCSPFRSPGKLLQCPHQMPAEQSFPALGARGSGWCPGLFAQLSGSPSSPTRLSAPRGQEPVPLARCCWAQHRAHSTAPWASGTCCTCSYVGNTRTSHRGCPGPLSAVRVCKRGKGNAFSHYSGAPRKGPASSAVGPRPPAPPLPSEQPQAAPRPTPAGLPAQSGAPAEAGGCLELT